MTDTKKLSLAEAMAKKEIERHNSAINNAVLVLTGIADVRKLLQKELSKLEADEAYVNKLAERTDEDPISVNDDEKLHTLYCRYGSYRGGGYTIGAR